MDYERTLKKLEELRQLAEKGERTAQDRDRMAIVYGELEEVFHQFLGVQKIAVEVAGRGSSSAVYPNLFAAGYLSGRTFFQTPAIGNSSR